MGRMELIKRIRKELGISKYALAKRLGITTSGVQHYERPGGSKLSLPVLCRLKRLSGLSWNQLGQRIEEEFNDEIKRTK